jgi:hypothetical protein
MMIESEAPSKSAWPLKRLFRLVSGGIVGFVAATAMSSLIDSPVIGGLEASSAIAALVGVFYGLMGISILVGSVMPSAGAAFLNVEDADEIREQKRLFLYSGASSLLWGGALIALALAAPDGPLAPLTALIVAAICFMVGAAVSLPMVRAADELMKAVMQEGGSLSTWLLFAVIGSWAGLAHLGYAKAPQPLDLLSLFYVIMLAASFIVVFRRGMVRKG